MTPFIGGRPEGLRAQSFHILIKFFPPPWPQAQEDEMRLDLGVGTAVGEDPRLVCLFLPVTQPGHPALTQNLPVDQPHCSAHMWGLVVC